MTIMERTRWRKFWLQLKLLLSFFFPLLNFFFFQKGINQHRRGINKKKWTARRDVILLLLV